MTAMSAESRRDAAPGPAAAPSPAQSMSAAPGMEKLLLATDLSEASSAATEEAFELAARLGASLLVVSVIDPGRSSFRAAGSGFASTRSASIGRSPPRRWSNAGARRE